MPATDDAIHARYTDSFGPNVQQILVQATRVIRGKVPSQVRAELRAAVKAGALGHLKKDGLKPEVFYHPDHKHGAIELQRREGEYAIGCISSVMCTPAAARDGMQALGIDVEAELISRTRHA